MSLKFKIAVHVIAGAAYHTCRLWLGKLFGLYFSITDCNGKDQMMQERNNLKTIKYINQEEEEELSSVKKFCFLRVSSMLILWQLLSTELWSNTSFAPHKILLDGSDGRAVALLPTWTRWTVRDMLNYSSNAINFQIKCKIGKGMFYILLLLLITSY